MLTALTGGNAQRCACSNDVVTSSTAAATGAAGNVFVRISLASILMPTLAIADGHSCTSTLFKRKLPPSTAVKSSPSAIMIKMSSSVRKAGRRVRFVGWEGDTSRMALR
jgi:hypothetical protein